MTQHPKLHPDLMAHLSKIVEYIGPLESPLHGYIAGGAAVHAYTGDRMFTAVAIEWSHRVAIPPDLAVFEMAYPHDPEDTPVVTVNEGLGDYLGSFPPNWKQDALQICQMGDVVLQVISPLDLAVSKVARLLDRDWEDIQALARLNLISASEFETKSMEAIAEYVGDTAFIQRNIRDVLGLINAHADRNDENQGHDMKSGTSGMDILSDDILCNAIAAIVSETTFESEYKSGTQPMPEITDRLVAIEHILEGACVHYAGDKDAAKRFLLRKHPLLESRSPLQIILENPKHADVVATLLLRAGAGFPV